MRVISGIFKGRTLKTPTDLTVRPTSDRLRESLFNILSNQINNEITFLDLCAGTGAIGIEALSRGAKFVTFVDKSRKSCGLVETNLDLLAIPDEKASVVLSSAVDFVKRTKVSVDFVYFDPPYDSDYVEVLSHIGDAKSLLLNNDSVVIVEHFHKKLMPEICGELRRWRIVKQGDSSLSFYHKN
jgi:16S rRNA (guanine966-N2)-methyltransferase